MPAARPRRLVALTLSSPADLWAAVRRAWSEGNAVAPLDPSLPTPALTSVLAQLRPHVLVTERGEESLADPAPTSPDVAAVILTSGTEGTPKAVELSHAALQAAARLVHDRLGAGEGDRWYCPLPLHHVGGFSILVRSQLLGTEPVLRRFDATRFEPEDATLVSLVPTMLARLLDHEVDLTRFRWVLLGGAAVPPTLLDRARAAGVNVVRTYGMTETCGGVVYDGIPLSEVEVRIADSIEISSPTLFTGYRNDRAPTSKSLRDGWFVTSDIGEWEDGELKVLGRRDEVIVTGGEKVAPLEVENILASHPLVEDCAVVGLPDTEWGQKVVAVVVTSGTVTDLTAELRAYVAQRAAPYKTPKEIHLVRSIPRNPSGKIDRKALRTSLGDTP